MNNALLTKAGISLCTLLIMILGGSFYSADESISQGDLIIMPRRVVLDSKKRTQELNLANTGTDSAKYLISVVHYRMLENGAFEEISEPDPEQHFADKNFRFFPRSVTLAPNESQTVKVQVINTNELKPGEYRSHLYFRAVPKETAPEDKDAALSQSLSVKLVPTFGIAIPIIIRNGNSTLNVKIEKPTFSINSNGAPQLNMTFNRTGNMSAYGDIKVEYIAANGKATQVGIAKGFAIYTPNPFRNFILNLEKKPGIDYKKGKLNIIYTVPSESKPVVIASSQVDLF